MQTVLPVLSVHLLILNGPTGLVPNTEKERSEPVVLTFEHIGCDAFSVHERDALDVQESGVSAVEVDRASRPKAVLGLPVVHMVVNQVHPKAEHVASMGPA